MGAHRAQRAPVTFSCLFVQSEDREKLSGIIMYLPSKNEKELSNDSSQKKNKGSIEFGIVEMQFHPF